MAQMTVKETEYKVLVTGWLSLMSQCVTVHMCNFLADSSFIKNCKSAPPPPLLIQSQFSFITPSERDTIQV